MLPPADPRLITVDRCTYVLITYCTMCLTSRVPVRHNTQYSLKTVRSNSLSVQLLSIVTLPQLWTASHQINRRLCTTYCSLTQIVCWSMLVMCTGLRVQKLTISCLVFRRLHFTSSSPDPLSGLVLPRPTGQPLNDDTHRSGCWQSKPIGFRSASSRPQ